MPAPRVYLDHAASCPPLPQVLAALPGLVQQTGANPSAAHAEGRAARAAIEAVRDRLVRTCRLARDGVVFTSGATEANNLVLRSFERGDGAVVVSPFEHPSVAAAAARFAAGRTVALPLARGAVDLDGLRGLLSGRPVDLVCLMHVQNETGLELPVAEVGRVVGETSPRTRFLVDAVQSFARLPLDLHAARIDFLAFSGHKIGALKGSGGLLVRDGARAALRPLAEGGGQEGGLRPGTENALAIASLLPALDAWAEHGPAWRAAFAERADQLREWCSELPGVAPLPAAGSVPWIVGLVLHGLPVAEPVVRMLCEEGFAVSAGAACATGKPGPALPAAAAARGTAPDDRASAAYLRVSLGPSSLDADLERFPAALRAALSRAKGSA